MKLLAAIAIALAGVLLLVTLTTKVVRARQFANGGTLTNSERMRVYGDRVRVALDEHGLQVVIAGLGLAAAILLGALAGGL